MAADKRTPAERGARAATIVVLNTWVLIPLVWTGATSATYGLQFMAWSAALLVFISTILVCFTSAAGAGD